MDPRLLDNQLLDFYCLVIRCATAAESKWRACRISVLSKETFCLEWFYLASYNSVTVKEALVKQACF